MENIKIKPPEELLLKILETQYKATPWFELGPRDIESFEDWLVYWGYADKVEPSSEIKPQDQCCSQCGQYNGHAIHCVFNIAEY